MAKTLPERRLILFNQSIRIMLALTVKYRKQDKSICIYIVESKFVKLTTPTPFPNNLNNFLMFTSAIIQLNNLK